jgi:carbon monoxide dehydrogenase subunit G
VFAYVADPANLPEWQESVHAVHRADAGPVGVGTQWTEDRTVLRRGLEATVEVVEYDLDRRLTLRSKAGPVDMRVEHLFEQDGEATRLRLIGEGELGGLAKLAGPMVKRQADEIIKADLGSLKRRLEAG